jgi:hypothetical protein
LPLSSFTLSESGQAGAAGADPTAPAVPVQPRRYDPFANLPLKPYRSPRLAALLSKTSMPRGGLHPLPSAAVNGPARTKQRFPFTAAGAQALAASRQKGRVLAGLASAAARSGAAIPRRVERRFGAPLTLTQVARTTGELGQGVVLSRTLLGADLEEGLNTLVVSIAPPGGGRVETSCAFFADAPGRSSQPKPDESRLPQPAPPKMADLEPQKPAGKFLLRPKAERLSEIATQKRLISDRENARHVSLLATMFPTARLKSLAEPPGQDSSGEIARPCSTTSLR